MHLYCDEPCARIKRHQSQLFRLTIGTRGLGSLQFLRLSPLRVQDINMGCPIDLVCNKGAGSSLLQRPGKMADVVRAASRCLSVPLTFKTRKVHPRGWPLLHIASNDRTCTLPALCNPADMARCREYYQC